MDSQTWPAAPVPDVPGDVWRWQLPSVHDASRVRMDLRARLAHPSLTSSSTEDAREGLLLAFEELASNALRHGGGAVEAVIVATRQGWLLTLSDESPDRPPVPAVDRDPALGGMGLPMVAQLSVHYGYAVDAERKTVWAQLTSGVPVGGAPTPRGSRA
ncbi:ATP-binding protein [Modestobacter sp. Leaf380]|uniref:ATP-binding protein n=1 Tax=Modestobacter sp. Leaf380 TaxID=1736356 RepID=UPI0006F58A53|nr:ATP-binding protein [Modestobacter sp. Leaf380]KQS66923.1 histidine kinase [Modestobacter sp. Leaf380]